MVRLKFCLGRLGGREEGRKDDRGWRRDEKGRGRVKGRGKRREGRGSKGK